MIEVNSFNFHVNIHSTQHKSKSQVKIYRNIDGSKLTDDAGLAKTSV